MENFTKVWAETHDFGLASTLERTIAFIKFFQEKVKAGITKFSYMDIFYLIYACATPRDKRILMYNVHMADKQKVRDGFDDRPHTLYFRIFFTNEELKVYVGIGVNGKEPGNVVRIKTTYPSNISLNAAIFDLLMQQCDKYGYPQLKIRFANLSCFDLDVIAKELGHRNAEELKKHYDIRKYSGTVREAVKEADLTTWNGKQATGIKQAIDALTREYTLVLSDCLTRGEADLLEKMLIHVFRTQECGLNIDGGGDCKPVCVPGYELNSCYQKSKSKEYKGYEAVTENGIRKFTTVEKAKESGKQIVAMKDIPKIYAADIEQFDTLKWKSFSRGTAEEAKKYNAIPIANGKCLIYMVGEDAFWYSESPIIDINECATEFFKRIRKSCKVSPRGLDLSLTASAEMLQNNLSAA